MTGGKRAADRGKLITHPKSRINGIPNHAQNYINETSTSCWNIARHNVINQDFEELVSHCDIAEIPKSNDIHVKITLRASL